MASVVRMAAKKVVQHFQGSEEPRSPVNRRDLLESVKIMGPDARAATDEKANKITAIPRGCRSSTSREAIAGIIDATGTETHHCREDN